MRKGLIRFVLSSVYVSVLLAPATMNAFDIVKDGKPVVTVVVPVFTKEQKETDQRWTGMAANWFTNYVRKATGAEIKIVTEGTPVEGKMVSIGHTTMADKAGVSFNGHPQKDKLAELGNVCRLTVKDNAFFLIGKDQYGPADHVTVDLLNKSTRHVNMSCYGAKGTCQAVVRFLEDYAGCRWYLPTPQGECVPSTSNLSVPDDLDKTSTPVFPYVLGGIYNDNYNPKSPAQMANNGWPGIALKSFGGHSWNDWVPVHKYGKDHPEYFALINGKRVLEGNHLCTSNPEVRELLLKEIRAAFDAGFDWVELGQSDGYRRCECPECEKLDDYRRTATADNPNEPPCERIFLLHKYIIDECKKSHPDKIVQLMVYGPTIWPSKKIGNFGDNVVAEVCGYYDQNLPLWKSKVLASTVYVYLWNWFRKGIGPKVTPKAIAKNIRLFRENNVVGIFFCYGGEDWGLDGPAYYAAGRLLGNPDVNPDDCVKDYCVFVYGKASVTMLEFFDLMYKSMDSVGDLADSGRPDISFPAQFPPQALQKLNWLLERAEGEADTERSKGWLMLTRICFDYLRANSEMYALYHAYQIRRDLPSLRAMRESVDKWNACRQKMLDAGKDKDYVKNWYPTWYLVENYLKSEVEYLLYKEPITLDFDALAKSIQNKSAGPVRITAARAASAVNPEAGFDSEVWGKTTACPLSGLNGVAISAGTTVRALFDDKNLYLGFECDEPEPGGMKLAENKHDGGIWNNDCLEVLLDPRMSGAQYYHFIASPREGSSYDARFGFISDPLDPMMSKEDTSWNPDWKYFHKIDAGKKKWTMVISIPFAALGVETPPAGGCWAVNFGRERYAGKTMECSLWSPNELGTGFCEPASFGRLYFEKVPEK